MDFPIQCLSQILNFNYWNFLNFLNSKNLCILFILLTCYLVLFYMLREENVATSYPSLQRTYNLLGDNITINEKCEGTGGVQMIGSWAHLKLKKGFWEGSLSEKRPKNMGIRIWQINKERNKHIPLKEKEVKAQTKLTVEMSDVNWTLIGDWNLYSKI